MRVARTPHSHGRGDGTRCVFSSEIKPRVPLLRNWSQAVRSAVLRVISLAQFCVTEVRDAAANGGNARIHQAAEVARLT